MLEVQKFLTANGVSGLKHLADTLHITVKEKDNRVLLKYDQIDSPMANTIVQECRGIILDKRDWSVVSYPFKKFFNYGEGHAAPLDLSNAYVQEKIDGTCMTLYFYNKEWHVQTLGMMDAEGGVGWQAALSFADLFWQVLGVAKEEAYKHFDKHFCYTFEVATKFNRVVTRYDNDRVVLLSVRDIRNLQEIPYSAMYAPYFATESLMKEKGRLNSENVKVELPKIFPMGSLEEIAKMSAALPQMEEGYVVVDKDFNRVKIKNPAYVAIAHLKESSTSSAKGLVSIALTNEGSEFLTYFPEYVESYTKISGQIKEITSELEKAYDELKGISNQKDFALALQARNIPFYQLLFSLRAGKIKSILDGVSQLDARKVIEVLNLKDAGEAAS